MSERYFLNGTAFSHDSCKHASCCNIDICPLSYAFIQHAPNLGGTIFYIVLFSAILVVQLGLVVKYRTWYFGTSMACGLILEVLGYVGRLMMRNNPFNFNAFLLNLIPLTIGPAFICAGIYICLGRIVVLYGDSLSRVRPSTYTFIFVSSDILSLVLQAAGGAISSIAPDNNASMKQAGINIMLAGLASQVASLAVFLVLCADFGLNVMKRKDSWNISNREIWASRRWILFLFALAISTVTILARSAYRVAELSQGFSGSLFNNEVTFMILEGAMVAIACSFLTMAYPGYAFKGSWTQMGFRWGRGKGDTELSQTEKIESGGASRDSVLLGPQ